MSWNEGGHRTHFFYEIAAFGGGGKGGGGAPPAPDPTALANMQASTNLQTAQQNAMLNRVSEFGPDGNIQFGYINGNPNFPTETVNLAPQDQDIFNLTRQGQEEYAQAADAQIGAASGNLSQPFTASIMQPNTNFNNIRDQSINAGLERITPQLKMQQEDLNSQLLNEGITQNSAAWNNAQRQFGNQVNDAYEQNILNAENLTGQAIGQQGQLVGQQGQTIQQQMAVRDLPLNEAASMLTGSQVSMPQFTPVPQTNVAPTDVIGASLGGYNAQMQGYNANVQANSAAMGGMYGLGGAAIMGGAIII